MALGRLQDFFGDDLEDALDSLKSAPGAIGNILVAAVRQVRVVDVAAFSVVVAGWALFAFGVSTSQGLGLLIAAMLPTVLWFIAGAVGGVVFHVGGIGYRSLGYWESYVLILMFAVFGVLSFRLALNPRDRRIHRPTPDS